MFLDVLAREYDLNGYPTGWVWYIECGRSKRVKREKVIVIEGVEDINRPNILDREVTIITLREFIIYQAKAYDVDKIVYTEYLKEPDFNKLFKDETIKEENFCLVVYDFEIWRKILMNRGKKGKEIIAYS